MRILFCDYEYPPLGGGGGVINAWLAEELAKRHFVTILTSGAEGLPKEEVVNGVLVVRVPVYFRKQLQTANFPSMAIYILNAILKGRQLLKQESYDIINTFFVIPTGPVGHILSKLSGLPNVLSVLGGDIYDPSKKMSPHRVAPLRAAVRHMLQKADVVTGESGDVLANIAKYYNADLDTKFIPLGIPRPPRVAINRTEFSLDNEDFLLVTVGRLVTRKAVDRLLHIISRLQGIKLKLCIIGGGPQESHLIQLSIELGIEQKVRFFGHASDEEKNKLLLCADAYVSTSQHEGFGLVFLEAMAAGLPVVCYNHGGQTDFLSDQVNGFVVNLNDEKRFQHSIEQLAEQPELVEKYGKANLRDVEDYFIETCALQYEELYSSFLSNK